LRNGVTAAIAPGCVPSREGQVNAGDGNQKQSEKYLLHRASNPVWTRAWSAIAPVTPLRRNLIVFFRTGTYWGDLVVKGSVRRCAAKGRTVEAWSNNGNVVRVTWG
jgi:hypothetical protein